MSGASSRLTVRGVFWLTFLSMSIVQLAWILALPAFHGIDEFDHVFKAEAVAHGQLLPSGQVARHGRGGIVAIPKDVADAAGPVCSSYKYTGPDNCTPVSTRGDGLVKIASAAATYNPIWYAVMGMAARPFTGGSADYAMRVAAALVSALLCAWGAAVTTRGSRDSWPLLGYCLAITPVLVYSSAVASPNGIEYAGALLTWAAALALARGTAPARAFTPLVVGSFALCTAHSTGVAWLLVILLAALLLARRQHWLALAHLHRRATFGSVAAIGTTVLTCTAYVLLARTNIPDSTSAEAFAFNGARVMAQDLLWPLQAVAAFPMREEAAPPVVYLLWLLPLVTLLVLATRAATRRERSAALLVLGTSIVVPTVLSAVTYSAMGTAWQGRYSLPLYVGLPILAGVVMSGRRPLRVIHLRGVIGMLAIATAVGVANVARNLVDDQPGVSAAQLFVGGWLVVALLAGGGNLLLLRLMAPASPAPSLRVPEPDDSLTRAVAGAA